MGQNVLLIIAYLNCVRQVFFYSRTSPRTQPILPKYLSLIVDYIPLYTDPCPQNKHPFASCHSYFKTSEDSPSQQRFRLTSVVTGIFPVVAL
jgi:hypothetical protein